MAEQNSEPVIVPGDEQVRRLLHRLAALAGATVVGAVTGGVLLWWVPFAPVAGAVTGVVFASLFLGGCLLGPVVWWTFVGAMLGMLTQRPKFPDPVALWSCVVIGTVVGVLFGLEREVRQADPPKTGPSASPPADVE